MVRGHINVIKVVVHPQDEARLREQGSAPFDASPFYRDRSGNTHGSPGSHILLGRSVVKVVLARYGHLDSQQCIRPIVFHRGRKVRHPVRCKGGRPVKLLSVRRVVPMVLLGSVSLVCFNVNCCSTPRNIRNVDLGRLVVVVHAQGEVREQGIRTRALRGQAVRVRSASTVVAGLPHHLDLDLSGVVAQHQTKSVDQDRAFVLLVDFFEELIKARHGHWHQPGLPLHVIPNPRQDRGDARKLGV